MSKDRVHAKRGLARELFGEVVPRAARRVQKAMRAGETGALKTRAAELEAWLWAMASSVGTMNWTYQACERVAAQAAKDTRREIRSIQVACRVFRAGIKSGLTRVGHNLTTREIVRRHRRMIRELRKLKPTLALAEHRRLLTVLRESGEKVQA